MTAAEKIKKIVEEKGIAPDELAAALGVSKGALHNWLKGTGRPSANAQAKLEKYCTGNNIPFE